MSENLYTPKSIRTYSGRYIDVSNINPADIFPIDIAIGLARECRFGNHTRKMWTVADHSIWCMLKAQELYPNDKRIQFRCLMHDAHEAYLGDWPSPMVDAMDQIAPGIKDALNTIKRSVQEKINSRFDIYVNPLDCPIVKEIDRMALEWEWEHKKLSWKGFPPIDPDGVADMFLSHFQLLVKTPAVIEP